jgi:hypothetical protein
MGLRKSNDKIHICKIELDLEEETAPVNREGKEREGERGREREGEREREEKEKVKRFSSDLCILSRYIRHLFNVRGWRFMEGFSLSLSLPFRPR